MAGYQAPQGWGSTPFWQTYALNFAEEGSDEQLAAILSHSAPTDFINSYQVPLDPAIQFDKNKDNPNLASYIATNEMKKRGKPATSDFIQRQQELKRGDNSGFISRYSQSLQKRLADDFNKNLKNYSDRGKATLREQTQQNLEGDFGSIDQSANSRGLLYSGKRQSARAGAAAQRANELGSLTSQYEQQLGDTGRMLNNASYASDINSLLQQQDLNSIASGAFFKKLQGDAADSAAMVSGMGSAGQGVGSVAGTASARKK